MTLLTILALLALSVDVRELFGPERVRVTDALEVMCEELALRVRSNFESLALVASLALRLAGERRDTDEVSLLLPARARPGDLSGNDDLDCEFKVDLEVPVAFP